MKHLKFLILLLIGLITSCSFSDRRSMRISVILDSQESKDTISTLTWDVRIHADSITGIEVNRCTIVKAIDSIYHSNLDTTIHGFKMNSKLKSEFKKFLDVNYPDYYITYSLLQCSKKCKNEGFDNHW